MGDGDQFMMFTGGLVLFSAAIAASAWLLVFALDQLLWAFRIKRAVIELMAQRLRRRGVDVTAEH